MNFSYDGKKMERKIGGKEIYQAIWLGEFVERKLIGFGYFLHEPTIMFSSQIVEKTKRGKPRERNGPKNVQHVFSC